MPIHGKITKEDFKDFNDIRILLAEDDIINQKVIQGIFADSGIDLVTVSDGQYLLDTLEEDSDFEFILMDSHMPRVDGIEATKVIRKNPNYNHLVIIAFSGDTSVDDIRLMREAGMQEHIEKPLKLEALYDILYSYTTSKNNSLGKQLNIRDGLKKCAHDVAFYKEILNDFTRLYSQSSQTLQKLLNENDLEELNYYISNFNAIAIDIGAKQISEISLELKKAALDNNTTQKSKLIRSFNKALKLLIKEIQEYQSK